MKIILIIIFCLNLSCTENLSKRKRFHQRITEITELEGKHSEADATSREINELNLTECLSMIAQEALTESSNEQLSFDDRDTLCLPENDLKKKRQLIDLSKEKQTMLKVNYAQLEEILVHETQIEFIHSETKIEFLIKTPEITDEAFLVQSIKALNKYLLEAQRIKLLLDDRDFLLNKLELIENYLTELENIEES